MWIHVHLYNCGLLSYRLQIKNTHYSDYTDSDNVAGDDYGAGNEDDNDDYEAEEDDDDDDDDVDDDVHNDSDDDDE